MMKCESDTLNHRMFNLVGCLMYISYAYLFAQMFAEKYAKKKKEDAKKDGLKKADSEKIEKKGD